MQRMIEEIGVAVAMPLSFVDIGLCGAGRDGSIVSASMYELLVHWIR